MAASFMPLVGGSNLIEVRDSGGSPMVVAQLSGVEAEGRAGSLKTSFLVSLFGAIEATTEIGTLWGNLASFDIYGPYSHPVPNSPAAAGFDYSSILPITHASLICADFAPVAPAWPVAISSFITATAPVPIQTYQLQATLTGVTAPAANPQQYGTYSFTLRGGVPDDENPILSPLILVEVDFSHSVGN
jgi:hypothetical protein